jgi:hypothetical protein
LILWVDTIAHLLKNILSEKSLFTSQLQLFSRNI